MRRDLVRAAALAAGALFYSTGKACANGHAALRYTKSGFCAECRKTIDRNNYTAKRTTILERRKRHNARAEVKAARKAYRQTNRERDALRWRERYYADHRATLAASMRWRQKNKDYLKRKRAERGPYPFDWRAHYRKNAAKINARQKLWQKANPEYHRAAQNARRARLLQALPAWADRAEIQNIYLQARAMELTDGIRRHVDHIVPLQGRTVCGLHVANNLQILVAHENLEKSNRLIAPFHFHV